MIVWSPRQLSQGERRGKPSRLGISQGEYRETPMASLETPELTEVSSLKIHNCMQFLLQDI